MMSRFHFSVSLGFSLVDIICCSFFFFFMFCTVYDGLFIFSSRDFLRYTHPTHKFHRHMHTYRQSHSD